MYAENIVGVDRMRRKEREMDRMFALAVLDKALWMTLSMTGLDGRPYSVPVNMTRSGEWLYLHSAQVGEKAACLRAHPEVCVAAVGDTRLVPEKYAMEYESAVVRGYAEEILDEEERQEALRVFSFKFRPESQAEFEANSRACLARTALFRVHMDEVTAKRMKFGPDGEEVQSGGAE